MATRRTVLKYVAGAFGSPVLGLDGLASLRQSTAGDGKPPNIVCIIGEGLRSDEFSCAGNRLLRTPNMDRIGQEGCRFGNAFVVNALCLPSRATMLTGLYSHTTGAVSNVEGKLPDNARLVPDMLQQAGYEIAFLGKSHIEGALMDRRWDYYFGFVGQADYYRPVITEGFEVGQGLFIQVHAILVSPENKRPWYGSGSRIFRSVKPRGKPNRSGARC